MYYRKATPPGGMYVGGRQKTSGPAFASMECEVFLFYFLFSPFLIFLSVFFLFFCLLLFAGTSRPMDGLLSTA